MRVRAASILLALLALQSAQAAHIIGGEIYYDHLGNDQYRVTLKLYRDCAGTNFDPGASIGVFHGGDFSLVSSHSMPFPGEDPVPIVADNPCLTLPPNICLRTVSYTIILTLPPNVDGYIIGYQRCCRVPIISNLVNPGAVGLTCMTRIPGQGGLPNSSARFSALPPVALCLNAPLVFDHSATDPDGDQLVYELCTPWDGGTQFNPAPVPPFNPPYTPIPWGAGYAAANPINSNPPAAIDPVTGILSLRPTQLGNFVIGVCVSEYRNGVLLSTTIRDIMFMVVACGGPTAAIAPQQPLCNGLTATFGNNSNGAQWYSWDFGEPGTTADTSNLANPAWTYSRPGTYTVRLIANPGTTCADTVEADFRMYFRPEPFFDPPPPLCGALQTTLTVSGNHYGPGATVSWDLGPGATPPTATGPQVSVAFPPAVPGGWPVTVTVTENGCTGTFTANVEPNMNPVSVTASVSDVSCFGRNDAAATVTTTGGTPPFTWSWNTVPPQNNAMASNLPPGTWWVHVSDVNGCADSTSVTISEPALLQTAASATPATCDSTDGTATVTATGGTPPFSYSWNTVPSQNAATATNLTAGQWTVIVTDANGCASEASAVVTTPTAGTLSMAHTDVSCNGGADGSAMVTVTGGTPPFTYAWNTMPAQNTATATGVPAGTWTVSVTDNAGCARILSVVIPEPPPLVLTAASTPSNCGRSNGSVLGDAIGGTPPYGWSWNTVPPRTTRTVTGIPAGPWTVTITDAKGCTATAATTVDDVPGPVAEFTAADVCAGSTVTFVNTSTGQSTISLSWELGDGSGSNLGDPTHVYPGPGLYTVTLTVTDTAGCTSTVSRDVTVHPIPEVDFSAGPLWGCPPVRTAFINSIPPPGGTCHWDFGDGSTSMDCDNPVHPFVSGGCFTVSLTVASAAGCVNRQVRDSLVCVTPLPVVDFTISPGRVPDFSPEVGFRNRSLGAVRYQWNFNNGDSVSSGEDLSLDLEGYDLGLYGVCLRAWNDSGCVDSLCKVFLIYTDLLVHVPNAFTPDGDGINDIFIPILTGHGAEDYEFRVLNRWGELVFGTNNPGVGWDGTYQGGMSPSGVYVWKLKAKPAFGTAAKEYVGHVSLLR